MSEVNPYQTPGSEVTIDREASHDLAGRGQRLGAALIDGIIVGLGVAPIVYLTGMFEYFIKGLQPPWLLMLKMQVISFLVFVAINYLPLSKYGQTVGKTVLNIRITDLQGNKPGVATLILKRYLPMQFVGRIPIIGSLAGLVDLLFIFRKDHRCVHDMIAGTQVVRSK